MLMQSNLERIAELKPESNSVFAYDNKIVVNHIVASWHRRTHRYENFTPGSEDAWLRAVETPPVSEQLQAIVSQVQQAVPNILALTNQLAAVLDNAANATSNLNIAIIAAQPMLTNFAVISGQLREPGGLGAWALGTNGSSSWKGL